MHYGSQLGTYHANTAAEPLPYKAEHSKRRVDWPRRCPMQVVITGVHFRGSSVYELNPGRGLHVKFRVMNDLMPHFHRWTPLCVLFHMQKRVLPSRSARYEGIILRPSRRFSKDPWCTRQALRGDVLLVYTWSIRLMRCVLADVPFKGASPVDWRVTLYSQHKRFENHRRQLLQPSRHCPFWFSPEVRLAFVHAASSSRSLTLIDCWSVEFLP